MPRIVIILALALAAGCGGKPPAPPAADPAPAPRPAAQNPAPPQPAKAPAFDPDSFENTAKWFVQIGEELDRLLGNEVAVAKYCKDLEKQFVACRNRRVDWRLTVGHVAADDAPNVATVRFADYGFPQPDSEYIPLRLSGSGLMQTPHITVGFSTATLPASRAEPLRKGRTARVKATVGAISYRSLYLGDRSGQPCYEIMFGVSLGDLSVGD